MWTTPAPACSARIRVRSQPRCPQRQRGLRSAGRQHGQRAQTVAPDPGPDAAGAGPVGGVELPRQREPPGVLGGELGVPGRCGEPEHEQVLEPGGTSTARSTAESTCAASAWGVTSSNASADSGREAGVDHPVTVQQVGDELLPSRARLVVRPAVPAVHLGVDDRRETTTPLGASQHRSTTTTSTVAERPGTRSACRAAPLFL